MNEEKDLLGTAVSENPEGSIQETDRINVRQSQESANEGYRDNVTVNGVEMLVSLVGEPGDIREYEMYFPQIELGDKARRRGVPDQIIRISEDPETAKKVFEYASEAAKLDGDVYSLYKKVDAFARELE